MIDPLYFILAMVGALLGLLTSVAEKLGSTGVLNSDHLVVLATIVVALALVAGTFVYLRKAFGPEARRYVDDA